MKRRDVLKAAAWGGAFAMLGPGLARAELYYPSKVEKDLWQGINRVKNPAEETTLEKLHSPVISVPDKIEAGKAFPVQIDIGKIPHPMGPSHWIEHLQLNIGNEPAGTTIFRSHGYCNAAASFNTVLGDTLRGKTVSLIVQIKCNMHGIWQNSVNVAIV
jgi:superoxide reductase